MRTAGILLQGLVLCLRSELLISFNPANVITGLFLFEFRVNLFGSTISKTSEKVASTLPEDLLTVYSLHNNFSAKPVLLASALIQNRQ